MHPLLRSILFLSCLALLAGCAGINSPRDPVMLEIQKLNRQLDQNSKEQNARMERLEKTVAEIRVEVRDRQKSNADDTYSMNLVVEELNQLKQQMDDSSQRLNELYDKVLFMQESLNQLSMDGNRTTPSDETATPAPTGAVTNPESLYQTALTDYRKKNYDLAIIGFSQFINNFPQTNLAGNAQYWLGESHYSKGAFSEALAAFDKVLMNYPNNNKAASAQLKKAYSLLELGKTFDAKRELSLVSKKFPDSREAQLAAQKLQQLGN